MTQRVGGLRQGSSSLDPARPGASVALGGGCPATVAKDIPLREPPPPLPLPPAVPGPRQRKTKTRAEETAAGAPPEKKPGQKAQASRPRCPASEVLALPPGSVPPALAAPLDPAPCLPSSFPPPGPGQLSLRPPPLPSTSRSSLKLCPRCPRRAPQAVPAKPGFRDPGPAAISPAVPGSAPFPGPAPHLRGPGLRAGRDPDQAEGDSIHRAAAEALLPGHCWGRGQGPGRGGDGGAGSAPSLLPLRFRRGELAASPWGS